MRQLQNVTLLLLGIFCLVACSESDDKENSPVGTKSLQVTPGKLNFTAAGSTQTLQVKTSYPKFGYNIPVDWLQGDFKDDPTYNYITITALPNTTTSARTATINVTGADENGKIVETVPVSIEQEGKGGSGYDNTTVVGTGSAEITEGDMTLTITSGTFTTADATVGIRTLPKGSILGEDEISDFYEINMPVNTEKEIKVTIKSQNTDKDLCFVAHAPTVALSSLEYGYGDVVSKPSYKDGVYTAAIPDFPNPDISETNTITVGLAHVDSDVNQSRTRSDNENKVGNVSWHIDKAIRLTSIEQDKVSTAKDYLNQYIRQALTIIQDFGFKVGFKKLDDKELEERDIHIIITDLGKDDGQFCQSAFGNKYSVVKIHKKWIKQLAESDNHDELKRTVIHELLHYYQADYDPRWAPSKYRNVASDELMMYESTAPWIEKKMCNNEFSSSFVYTPIQSNHGGFMRGFNNLADIYPTLSEGERYQAHGYAMPLLVEFIIQNKYEGEKALVELYKIWKERGGTTFKCYDLWTNSFLFKYDADMPEHYYNHFIEQASIGKVVPFFDASKFHSGDDNNDIRNDCVIELTDKCYPYGGIYNELRIFKVKDALGNYSVKGKELTIEQKSAGLTTKLYLYHTENEKYVFLKTLGEATPGSPIVIKDENTLNEIHTLDKKLVFMYLVTTSMESQRTIESDIVITFQDAKPTLTVEPDALEFDAAGGTKSVKITSNQPTNRLKYKIGDKSWISASGNVSNFNITVTPNTSKEAREDSIYCYAVNDAGDKLIQKAIAIKQKASTTSRYLEKYKNLKYINVTLHGKVDRSWANEGESPATTTLSINNWPTSSVNYNWQCTWTEIENGLQLVSQCDEENVRIVTKVDIIEEADRLLITHLSFKYDYDNGESNGHTTLEAQNIPVGLTASYGNGTKENGCTVSQLTDKTKNCWGIVHTNTGPYFQWKFTTEVNGLADDDYRVYVSFSFNN